MKQITLCMLFYLEALLLPFATSAQLSQPQIGGLCKVRDSQKIWVEGLSEYSHNGGPASQKKKDRLGRSMNPYRDVYTCDAKDFMLFDVCDNPMDAVTISDTTTLSKFEDCLLKKDKLSISLDRSIIASPVFEYADSSFEITTGSLRLDPAVVSILKKNARPHKSNTEGWNSIYSRLTLKWKIVTREGDTPGERSFVTVYVLCWGLGNDGGYKLYGILPSSMFSKAYPDVRFTSKPCGSHKVITPPVVSGTGNTAIQAEASGSGNDAGSTTRPPAEVPTAVKQVSQDFDRLMEEVISGQPLDSIDLREVVKLFKPTAMVEVKQCASDCDLVTLSIHEYIPSLKKKGYEWSLFKIIPEENAFRASNDSGPWTFDFQQTFIGESPNRRIVYRDITLKRITIEKLPDGKYAISGIKFIRCIEPKKCD